MKKFDVIKKNLAMASLNNGNGYSLSQTFLGNGRKYYLLFLWNNVTL